MDWQAVSSLLLEHIDQPALVIDDEGIVRLVNPALERLVGWPRHEVEGRHWLSELVPDHGRRATEWCMERALRGAIRRCDAVMATRDGRAVRMPLDLSLVAGNGRTLIVAVGDPAGVSEERPPREYWGLDYYEISSHEEDFGTILYARWDTAVEGADLVGRKCWELRYGLGGRCDQCPARGLEPGHPPSSAVFLRDDDAYDLVTAEAVGVQVARLRTRRVDSSEVSSLLRARVVELGHRAELSDREREVLDYLVMGRSLEDVGTILGISPRTVKFHQSNILQKLGADSRLDLMRLLL